ncbi:MAG TPA: DUF5906 domain-containing protein [Candidatus Wallbacteria bacterium]|nr:DUF5906 domain-containing protein [Candidatus Wallbacteria bacterium]
MQNCVLDFDSKKDKAKNPLEESLVEVTSAVLTLANNMRAAGFRLNKDFFVYFTGRAGYRLVIPAEVLGANFVCGQFPIAEAALKHFAHELIKRHTTGTSQECLTASLDNASFTKDRIMLTGYSLNSKPGGMLSFFFEESDLDASTDLEAVRTKSKAITAGEIPKLDFAGLSLAKNDALSAIFTEALDRAHNDESIPKKKLRSEKSSDAPTSSGDGVTSSIPLASDQQAQPGSSNSKKINPFDCRCIKYVIENCEKLEAAGKERFKYSMNPAILVIKLGGRDCLLEFNKRIAEKVRPGLNSRTKAEEWTRKTYDALKCKPVACHSVKGDPQSDKEGIIGIVDNINHNFELVGENGFRCDMNCPLYPKAITRRPHLTDLNRWALDYIFTYNVITYLNEFYRYIPEFGYYIKFEEALLEKEISSYLNVFFTEAHKNNIIAKIRASSTITKPVHEDNELCLNNGILNVETDALLPHTPAKHFFGKIDASYDPNGPEPQSELIDKFLAGMFPEAKHKERLEVLLEYFGYTLTTSTKHQIAVILASNGCSGKTTLARIWIKILRELATCLDGIAKVVDTRWGEELKNKTLCYVDEVNSTEFMSDGILKSRITGGTISYDTKYVKTNNFESTVKFIFGSNLEGINTTDFSYGFTRRFIIIEFPVNFDHPEYKSKRIMDAETIIGNDPAAKNRLFYLALQGLKRLSARGKFEISPEWQVRQQELLQTNNIYLEFARNFLYYQPGQRTFRPDVYRHAQAYAKDNGKMIKSARHFWHEVERVSKCSLSKDKPNSHYHRSNGHEYLKNIVLKGIDLSCSGKLEYINEKNAGTFYSENPLAIKPDDISVTEMSYAEYMKKNKLSMETATTTDNPDPLFDTEKSAFDSEAEGNQDGNFAAIMNARSASNEI